VPSASWKWSSDTGLSGSVAVPAICWPSVRKKATWQVAAAVPRLTTPKCIRRPPSGLRSRPRSWAVEPAAMRVASEITGTRDTTTPPLGEVLTMRPSTSRPPVTSTATIPTLPLCATRVTLTLLLPKTLTLVPPAGRCVPSLSAAR
jgi:hypothetical protein